MKNIPFLLLLFLSTISFISRAQIDPYLGIIAVDSTDFSTASPYIQINQNGLWQQGFSQKNYLQPSSLHEVLITDTLNNYAINVEESFEIHWPVHPHSIFNFILSFDHSMDTDSSLDGGRIEVSYDYGQTWIDIYEDALTNVAFNTENFYAPSDTLFDGRAGFSGQFAQRHSVLQWVWILALKSFPSDTMYYRFLFKSDSIDHQKEGWMLENIHFAYADMPSGLSTASEATFLFECSPNPAQDELHISTELNQYEISIFDSNGLLRYQGQNEKTLNLSGFSSGLYFIQLTTPEGKSTTRKLVHD
ncbi:MAG: T9SS type A sorting domain-containing protein [Flavobacteriales bacterium]